MLDSLNVKFDFSDSYDSSESDIKEIDRES